MGVQLKLNSKLRRAAILMQLKRIHTVNNEEMDKDGFWIYDQKHPHDFSNTVQASPILQKNVWPNRIYEMCMVAP
jgi:hypothetical protein